MIGLLGVGRWSELQRLHLRQLQVSREREAGRQEEAWGQRGCT